MRVNENSALDPDLPGGFVVRKAAALGMILGLFLLVAGLIAFFACELAIELQRVHHPRWLTIVSGGALLLLVRGIFFLRGSLPCGLGSRPLSHAHPDRRCRYSIGAAVQGSVVGREAAAGPGLAGGSALVTSSLGGATAP